jgi:glutamate 5-kinase
MKPRGRITVDAGAARALASGSSLLPAGVSAVAGPFGRGDPVELADETGRVLGQGLTRYDSDDADRIKRLRLDQIEAALGHPPRGPLVHRDDMAI